MKVFFDDGKDFFSDLWKLIETLDKFKNPLVVVPTEKDAKSATEKCKDGVYKFVTFISYDYWLSKKWIADMDYDHVDFFRMDQFFITKSFGVPVGVGTMRRMMSRKVKEEVKNETA